jgi:peptide/nickel transport system substrate-binding protein
MGPARRACRPKSWTVSDVRSVRSSVGRKRLRPCLRIRVGAGASFALALLVLTGCGGSGGSTASSTSSGSQNGVALVSSTPPPRGSVSAITWDSPFGEPTSLDPIHNVYYTPGTVLPNLCDQLYWTNPVTLRPEPDLAVSSSQPSPLTLVYNIRQGVKFWDGHPLTATDVVYSLSRNANPSPKLAGGLYPNFEFVKSITATGPYQVTIKLTHPDELLPKELAAGSGMIYEAAYAKSKGTSFGTSTGGIMCSGPFKLVSWSPGNQIVMQRNSNYWNKSLIPKVRTVTFKFITDPSALTSGLLSGAIDGTFEVPTSAIPELQAASNGHLYFGKSTQAWIAMPVGGLMTNPKIRKAMSLALDRPAIAKTVYRGAAQPLLSFAPPTSWGSSARSVYQTAYASLPGARPDVAAAKALVASAGSPTTPITFGYLAGNAQQTEMATILQSDAAAVGLHVKPMALTPSVYGNVSTGINIPKDLDTFLVPYYVQVADPFDEIPYFLQPKPGGYVNYINWRNSVADADLAKARQTYNPVKRAQLEVAAQNIYQVQATADIPFVYYDEVSFANNRITGFTTEFPYLFYPWAATIGATQ